MCRGRHKVCQGKCLKYRDAVSAKSRAMAGLTQKASCLPHAFTASTKPCRPRRGAAVTRALAITPEQGYTPCKVMRAWLYVPRLQAELALVRRTGSCWHQLASSA